MYEEGLHWVQVDDKLCEAEITGMCHVQIRQFDTDPERYSVMFNWKDECVIRGDQEAAKAWAEGYIAGRYQEMKIVLKGK